MFRLYGIDYSAPFRAVAMTAELSKATYDFVQVDPFKGETQKREFLALNSQHNVPVMQHGDFILNESRAISGYIASQFDKSGKLYPKDPKVNSRINQRLHFDNGVFYKSLFNIVIKRFFGDKMEASKEKIKLMEKALGWANDMLIETGFVANTEYITIADISFLATYSTIKACDIISLHNYKDLNDWAQRCSLLIPNYDQINQKGASKFGELYKEKGF
uniref:Glutathione S-transferase 1 n=1 Tax=Lepeophtheirus salmonis TaxID=72036 RepID=A0A0K2U3Y6_LEPSM